MRIIFKTEPRVCGPCRACCKVMGVQEGDFHKPKDRWCPHVCGHGCNTYATRPQPCRDFDCLWLTGFGGPEHRPDKIHGVLTATKDGGSWVIHEDPGYEGHARAVLKPQIDQWVARGAAFYVVVVCGTKRAFFGDQQTWARLMASAAPEVVGAQAVTMTTVTR
jgi:hypothetical protein